MDESHTFGTLYPLLAAFPTVEAVCAALPKWHRWHRAPQRLLDDVGLGELAGELICIRRIETTVGWEADNVVLVDVPDELRPYHRVEQLAWLRAHEPREPGA